MSPPIDLELRAEPSAIARARAALDDLKGRAPAQVLDNARLLVSELVTNSVRHAGLAEDSRIGLRVDLDAGSLRVEVSDPGPGFEPEERVLTIFQQSGWGLYLVDQLADRWGVDRDDGTTVWFEIDAAD